MTERPGTSIRWTLIILGVAVLYLGSARGLISLSAPPSGAVLAVWLPAGVSVAAMILFGPFAAVGSLLGSLAFELSMGTPMLGALGVATVNAISEIAAYLLFVRLGEQGESRFLLGTTRDVTRLLAAATVSGVVSATLGNLIYVLAGILKTTEYWPSWLAWFGSCVIGIVVVAPTLVYVVRERLSPRRWDRMGEYLFVLVMIACAAYLWRGPLMSEGWHEYPEILGILLLLFSAYRPDRGGAQGVDHQVDPRHC